jgi:hypothetical protein
MPKNSAKTKNPFYGEPLSFNDFKKLASPLKSMQTRRLKMQVYINKCLNKLLYLNNQKQFKTFAKANEVCYNKGLISFDAYSHCKIINNNGNNVKHDDVVYALECLEETFGTPDC